MSDPKALECISHAAERFAARLPARPGRIEARLDSLQGMPALCAVERVFARLLPAGTAKELVWLTRAGDAVGDRLHLRAWAEEGALLAEETLELAGGRA